MIALLFVDILVICINFLVHKNREVFIAFDVKTRLAQMQNFNPGIYLSFFTTTVTAGRVFIFTGYHQPSSQ